MKHVGFRDYVWSARRCCIADTHIESFVRKNILRILMYVSLDDYIIDTFKIGWVVQDERSTFLQILKHAGYHATTFAHTPALLQIGGKKRVK